ncbi:Pex12 amino terminal region-domain-containing protein [Mycotypha africana]|uniref:Pex12 amino terminal region-domain-containing protein n=1 Tax=Mycotypha africana TaxID=64632 RepID=UPI002300C0FC|nr:Pex12 amino terminal region-domain-containing protein [Mycotypha africana]KAI8984622.1 Pex12 amino terminal region-domain-containing protein [Mycotypha africana]
MEFMSAMGSQEDAYRPSLFELIAQEKLKELLQPAVQYIVAIYAQRYPRLLLKLVNHHEEFYALLMLLVERHYLKEWGGSFAENFYGLKRVSTAHLDHIKFNSVNSQTPALSSKDVTKSLLVLVGIPYVKCRLDLLYQKVTGGSASLILGDNEQEELENEELADPNTKATRKLAIRLKRLFKKVYPIINFIYYGSNLAYNVAYLFGKTRYYTPWLHLLGLEVKRMSMNDYRAHYDKMEGQNMRQPAFSLLKNPLGAISTILSKVIEFLKVLLPMSIFFFKFLEWWYSSEFSRSGGLSQDEDSANAIPPPEQIKPDPRGTKLPKSPNTCPLCLSSPINNPTALPSGYVFCYTCVYHCVEEHGRCPVTWIKLNGGTEQLTKLYADVM